MANQKKFLDYEGVKHLWSKVNMQDYPNNETLMAVINAIDETKADKSEILQADWNESDQLSLAYIKNKPDEDDAFELLSEIGMIEVAAATDGSIYIENTGVIYTL